MSLCISNKLAEKEVKHVIPLMTAPKIPVNKFNQRPGRALFCENYKTLMKEIKEYKKIEGCWRDDSEIKRNGCSSGGPGFSFKHPPASSQASVTQVPANQMPHVGL